MIKNLNTQQKKALKQFLNTKDNYFLTGVAGTGKSYVIKLFREVRLMQQKQIPIVASTGAAALLVNGITFNSYFGLGIMAGGQAATIANAMTNRALCERIIDTEEIVIEEISMIPGITFETANLLCQKIRQNKKFFGGIRLIIVGDFFQLGPFSETEKTDWAFESSSWKKSKIKKNTLSEVMRTKEKSFIKILSKVRVGKVDKTVEAFLNKKIYKKDITTFDGPIIFSRNKQVDEYNLKKLNALEGNVVNVKTMYIGEPHHINKMKENLVIGESIALKKGALVMTRVNNFNEGYVNGTTGHIISMNSEVLTIKTLEEKIIHIKKHVFEMVNGQGVPVAKAKNFPVILAWAVTIHKSQGASLNKALISLDNLWLHGQAYTALSRLSNSAGLHITKWNKSSFKVDKKVLKLAK